MQVRVSERRNSQKELRGEGATVPNQPEDLIFPSDTIRLPKSTLSRLCREYQLEVHRDTASDYNRALWTYIHQTNDRGPLASVLEEVWAGQTAVVWYKPPERTVVEAAVARLREGATDYFAQPIIVPVEQMADDQAYVIGACHAVLAGEQVTVVRLRARSGFSRSSDGINVTWEPTIGMATVILNTARGYIELRASSGLVPRLLARLETLFGIPETEMRPELIAPFARQTEQVADWLDGRAVRTNSRPDVILREITPEQRQAVLRILDAVSDAIAQPGEVSLDDVIAEVRESLVGPIDLTSVPLSVLMIAGFEQIGLTAEEGRDIREGPLYHALRERIEHYGGFVRFPVNEVDGNVRWHTIRLGYTTNSVAFSTKATEAAIKKVREVLLRASEGALEVARDGRP